MNIDFHDINLPRFLEPYVKHTIEFSTICATTKSGKEIRHSHKDCNSYARYNISNCRLVNDEFDELINFFYARRGKRFGFLFSDPLDNYMPKQVIYKSDNHDEYILRKIYSDPIHPFSKILKNPVFDTLKLYINNQILGDGMFEFVDGKINIPNEKLCSDDVISAECNFNLTVRFDHDIISYHKQSDDTIIVENISMVEIKL